ncbi:methylated-DNA--[protein]-cysteine S-methyltransferase [Candidatus Bandiella euplotis]|nr:methylated-DNA--[protein]-cysteine S-methyltransferase [Candidatus Bandiella woodruffii]
MFAVANKESLYLLDFVDRLGLKHRMEMICADVQVVSGGNPVTAYIRKEMKDYFQGHLRKFQAPLYMHGTEFQKMVWSELMKVPYGDTRSYLEQARAISKPTSFRAVANANAANNICIIIPCHRIINSNGELGGYGGGVVRKQWLLDHEKAASEPHTCILPVK